MPSSASCRILGVRLDLVAWPEILAFCQEALNNPGSAQQIITLNGEFVLNAQDNPAFKEVINNSDLVIADSTNIVWAANWLGNSLKERTPGSELTIHLVEMAQRLNKKVFFLGSQNGVGEQAAEKLRKSYPGLIIATSQANANDPAALEAVLAFKPDILLVAYGSPAQELWIAENKTQIGAALLVGVGGTFDMIAGRFPRAPKLFRALYLEWLWRLLLQPSRWRRAWKSVVVFPLKVLFSK